MSPDRITANTYNWEIDKRLACMWSGYARLGAQTVCKWCRRFSQNWWVLISDDLLKGWATSLSTKYLYMMDKKGKC